MRGAPTGKDNQPGSGDADPGSPEGDGGEEGEVSKKEAVSLTSNH